MESTSYNAWRLVSLSPLPRWSLWLAGAGLLLAFLWLARSVWRERKVWRRVALLVLRFASAALLFLLLLEPALQELQTAHVKDRFLLLIDGSRSMALPFDASADDVPQSRTQAVSAWARANKGALADLARRFQLEAATFGSELQPLDPERLFALPDPTQGQTDILAALRAAAAGATTQTRALAGVLLVSDGADNAQLQRGVGAPERTELAALGVPVNTVAVGRSTLKDLAVSSLQVDDFAFVRNPLTIDVTLRSQGFSGERVPVTLTRGRTVAAEETVTLDASGTTHARLTFTPDQTGEFVYTVTVPVLPGEAVAQNNKRAFVLKVIRDRVRVLLVCGRPSWDERFLRGLLRQDPNVDLVSFFILREPHDQPEASENELSLIPFPTEEIFRNQLHSFDLVVLQDFDYRPYSSGISSLHIESYFPDLKHYVQEGGALLMIGGSGSFGDGQYDQTELADVLPVTGVGLPPSEELFHVQLTEEGRRHPVTQLGQTGEQSAQLWASLPPVPGINLVRPKPGARVLLSHPLLSVGGASAPVLVVADEGRGRSMALMTDSSWRWSFEAAGEGLGNREYERFYTNAVRWLVRDPDLTPVKLTAAKRNFETGQPASFDVRARQADYGPAGGAQVTLTVIDAETEKQARQLKATAGRDGTVRLEVPDLPPGAYRAQVLAELGGVELGRGEQAFAVRESGPENEDPLPHPEILEKIAQATGGHHAELQDGFPRLKTGKESEEVEIGRRKEEPLWDNPIPLAAAALLLGTEWFLRRRWGLR